MKVLVIAPHLDDEVLGCGGTIAKHANKGDEVYLLVVTKGYPPDWTEEIIERQWQEVLKVKEILGLKEAFSLDLPAVKLDTIPQKELNDLILQYVNKVAPEVLYIPHRGDINKDHRLVFEAAMVAARPKPGTTVKKVLSYETISSTDWSGPLVENAFMPNVYVDISGTIEIKLRALSAYETEVKEFPHPRSLEAVAALAKLRGASIGVKAAEAFMLMREIWME